MVQPMLLDATRCYLLDRLYSTLTCTNGCSCWSLLEEIRLRFVVVSDTRYHCATRPLILSGQVNSGARSFAASSVTRPGHSGPAPTGRRRAKRTQDRTPGAPWPHGVGSPAPPRPSPRRRRPSAASPVPYHSGSATRAGGTATPALGVAPGSTSPVTVRAWGASRP
jgi:hypothetical protein